MDHQSFDAGATLTFLDDITECFGSLKLLSIEPAWDAAWVVCMTEGSRHEAVAQAALADVADEIDRLSLVSTPAWANAPGALPPP